MEVPSPAPNSSSPASLDDRDLNDIYDATGLLLILGEPGSGKTTTLLELARTLLGRVEKDIRERVPVVLNLSSWKKQPLVEWMSSELWEKYRVPRKIARSWFDENYLLPLLDGLDEVPTILQPDCVAAINAFIEEQIEKSKLSGLVVCCRLNEYRWLPERLKLNGAICLEPLSKAEVDGYLASGGLKLVALRDAVSKDSVLQELAQTPLMLSVMSLASQEGDGNEWVGQKADSPEQRRKQIFQFYIEQMFKREERPALVFPKEKTIGWLSWLAGKMREHSQSVFLVEGLQPNWLGTRAKQATYGTIVALSLALLFGLLGLSVGLSEGLTAGLKGGLNEALSIGLSDGLKVVPLFGLPLLVGVGLGCWSESRFRNGVVTGAIGGLSGGLYAFLGGDFIIGLTSVLVQVLVFGAIGGLGCASLKHITLVETVNWKWNLFLTWAISGSVVGLIVGLIALEFERQSVKPLVMIDVWLFVPFFGLVSGLVGGIADRVLVEKASPNQGIKLSLKNSLLTFLIALSVVGLLAGMTAGLTLAETTALSAGLSLGPMAGFIVGLNRGGAAVIKHYALRFTFWLTRDTLFNFIGFLDHCANLILLKKVGGGYIFIHPMLLEYFADISAEHTSAKR